MERRRKVTSHRSCQTTRKPFFRSGSNCRRRPASLHTGRITGRRAAGAVEELPATCCAMRSATGRERRVRSRRYEPARGMLADLSRSRALAGLYPNRNCDFRLFSQAAAVQSIALMSSDRTRRKGWPTRPGRSPSCSIELGLFTIEVYQKSREEVIVRQQQEMLELSTPVVKLWDGILALPLIGTLDSERTQVVMENLLQAIVEHGRRDRHHRHHRRADRRHAGGAAPAEDGRRRAADGRRLHHQRHPAADRADHRASRRRAERGHQGDPRRRLRAGAAAHRQARRPAGRPASRRA